MEKGRRRLQGRALPIVQAAVAAVLAWLLAGGLVAESRPAFAAIAALICVGVTHGRRGERAIQLAGGVVIGISAATLLLAALGPGPVQLGVLVVLAMGTAALLGGSEMVIVEAGVSAILLVTLDPATAGGAFSGDRILEALIGGASALAVGSVLFPADPELHAGRAGQAVYAALGRALQRTATGLEGRDADETRSALEDARAIDPLLAEARAALEARGRIAPRAARRELERYERSLGQVDLAVRNTRVLARDAARVARAGEPPAGVPGAIRLLEGAVWELAAAYDDPPRAELARRRALAAAARAESLSDARPELIGQVRSTAVDLVRAAELVAGPAEDPLERPTEELLAV